MIKEAIEKILSLAEPHFEDRFGVRYCSQRLHHISPPSAPFLEVMSLTGVVDYFKGGPESDLAGEAFLVVHCPTEVVAFRPISLPDKVRDKILEAHFATPQVDISRWTPLEEFLLGLQTCFVETAERNALLAVLGSVKDVNEIDYTESGASQKVVRKSGLHLRAEEALPSAVSLRPFRTFPEIEQPASPFVVRLRKQGDGVFGSLTPADGGAWEIEARAMIKAFLNEHLPETAVLA